MTKTKADTLYESLANFTTEEGAIECGAKMRDYARELEHFLDGERIARQYAIDKGCEIQRHNFLLMQAGKALRDALAFGCHKIGDVPREIDAWDALVSSLPNV